MSRYQEISIPALSIHTSSKLFSPMDPISQALITIGLLLLIGLFSEHIAHQVRLPKVTILLGAGILAGPSVLHFFPPSLDGWFPIVSEIALVMIGFVLGGEFTRKHIQTQGHQTFIVALTQACMTAAVTGTGLLLLGTQIETALLLAGIATATDPAATLAVIKETKAKGHFTSIIKGVVALDDLIGIILFSILFTTAEAISGQNSANEMLSSLWGTGGAILLGLLLGVPAAFLTGRTQPGEATREEALSIVFLCTGLALWLEVSSLLTAMTTGIVIANRATHHERPFHEIENIQWIFLIVFFVLAGASLRLGALGEIGVTGIGYVAFRTLGKITGARLGGRIAGLSTTEKTWLGATLLPQAGVAIGMALLSTTKQPDLARDVLPVTIAATVIFELVGPVCTHFALTRSGEIPEKTQ